MTKEYANQNVRDGHCEPSAAVRFDPERVTRLLKEYGGSKYIPADDLPNLIKSAINQLREAGRTQGEHYTFGFDSNGIKNLLCSLLRVPSPKPKAAEDPRLKGQTDSEVKEYAESYKEALRMAKKITTSDGNVATLEEFHKLLEETGNPSQVGKILVSAKAKDVALILPGGQELPVIAPLPKTLTAKRTFAVRLLVTCVDESENVATATLVSIDDPESPALSDLLNTSVRVAYSAQRPKLRRQLLGMQLCKVEFQCKVSVTRALRAKDAKHNSLRIIHPLKSKDANSIIVTGLQQLQLDFGEKSDDADS